MPNLRLFVGIAIAPAVLRNLARVLDQLRPLARLNWTPPENLHITLKFIGAWPEERLAGLRAALEHIPFGRTVEIAIAGFGWFPNPHYPHSFFAGVQSAPALAELAGRIDEVLLPLGIRKEARPFKPHLTLARIKDNQNVSPLRQQIAKMTDRFNFDPAQRPARVAGGAVNFGKFDASEFHLYSSQTTPNGSIYTSLSAYSLLTPASLRA